MANKKKSRKISKAMKEAWARRKAGSIPVVTNDPNIANVANSSYSGIAVKPELGEQRSVYHIVIERPDRTRIEIFERNVTNF